MATRIAVKTCIMACITAVLLFGVQAAKAQTQACCTPNGSCSDLPVSVCVSMGGIPAGAGTSCAGNPNICTERPCCLPDNSCQIASPQYCQQVLNGVPQPLGTTCAQAPCNQTCAPLPPPQVGCQPIQCPIAGQQCRPKCAKFIPGTNQYVIVDCECVNPTADCHLEIIGGGASPTVVPDNGTGTADLPPLGGVYQSPLDDMQIINGLPPGTTIQIDSFFDIFVDLVQAPGGSLGGEMEQYGATMHMPMTGTGGMAGFNRTVQFQVQCETHTAPRTPGQPLQSFDTDMFRLQGQLPIGDPDFDLLRITAGTTFGMPSPGHTTLTQRPGGNWAVDSFFDITYRIDFVGHPGGSLGGMSGSTTGTIRMAVGTGAPQCTNTCPPGQNCVQTVVTNADGSINVCCECQTPICQPNPTGTACQPIQCPILSQVCQSKCVKHNPFTGANTIIDCECEDPAECHVTVIPTANGTPCTNPGNGAGSVDLPAAGCKYSTPQGDMQITNGLNAGDTLQIDSFFDVFVSVVRNPGGPLGGETEQYQATMHMPMTGTGGLTGYNPNKQITIQCQAAAAPRTPGNPIQSFDTQMMGLQGQITGDPDFDLLRITAGNSFGMPSPGHTTLTQLPGGNWAVDSFFDITYRIDFVGHSPGPLGGHSGSTTGTIRMQMGTHTPDCTGICPPNTICERSVIVQADGTLNVCCNCVTVLPPVCEPNPTGTGCQPIQCPVLGEECKPRCANYNPQTGQSTVINCDCRPPDECHIENVVGAVPDCVGVCPPGKVCERTVTPRPDGSYDLCCECYDEPVCAPNANGTGCQPVVCPDPDEHCQPKCVRQIPGVVPPQFEVIDCECIHPNDCHIEVTAAAGPSCVGVCPPGQQCDLTTTVNPTDGSISYCCTCIPQICQPDPTGVACQPTQCPVVGQECEPRCVKFNPATGQTIVVDCDCRSPNECHVQVNPGAFPGCVGTCPPGKICEDTMTINADGTYTICCDCRDVDVCQPNSTGSGCDPVVCPDPAQQCHPKCVRQVPGITPPFYIVVDCDCMTPDDCHVEFDAAGGPTCVGVCPPGKECKEITRVNADGTTDLCCECHDLPQVCQANSTGSGCVPIQCPIAGEECRPKCAQYDPLTGQYKVVDCECIDPNQCHMEFPNVGAPPVCVGDCPPGQTCVQTTVVNLDGTTSICCECHQQSYPKFSQPPTPDREDIASNLDWNDQIPNVVIADDFQSDGRLITQVRWWGSYIDPRYAPQQFGGIGQAPFEIDGWLISFHQPLITGGTLVRPALGVYFAPAADVQIIATSIVPCDGHPVFEYLIDLSKCCLLCQGVDTRSGITPAQCDGFHEEHCFVYDIDIQAEVGRIYFKNGDCHQCLAASTVNSADGDFWGWHSTNIENGYHPALRSFTSVSHLTGDLTCQYGPWQKAPQVCTFPHRINMAFDLLTNNSITPLPCPPPPVVIQWRSVRTHTGLGPLPIVLNPTATGNGVGGPTVETRNGGIQLIEVDFDQPVVLVNPGAVTVVGRTTVGGIMGGPVGYTPLSVFMVDADTMGITFSAAPTAGFLPNETCYNFEVVGSVTNAVGQGLVGDTDCNARALIGDVTMNGVVTLADELATKAKASPPQPVLPGNIQYDVNLSGTLTIADVLLVKSHVINPSKQALCP